MKNKQHHGQPDKQKASKQPPTSPSHPASSLCHDSRVSNEFITHLILLVLPYCINPACSLHTGNAGPCSHGLFRKAKNIDLLAFPLSLTTCLVTGLLMEGQTKYLPRNAVDVCTQRFVGMPKKTTTTQKTIVVTPSFSRWWVVCLRQIFQWKNAR